MLEVAQALHSNPKLRLILAADDDAFTDGNPGITKATEAAKGRRWLPQNLILAAGGETETDFNDLHQRAGLTRLKVCIDAAAPVAKAPAFPPLEGGR